MIHLYGITVYCIPGWKLNSLSQSQIRRKLRLEQSTVLPVLCLTGSFSHLRFLLNKLPSQTGFIKTTQANCCLVTKLCPTLLWSYELQLVRLLCSWDFPGKDIEVGCHFHLQGSSWPNPHLLYLIHWQLDSLPPRHLGSPIQVNSPFPNKSIM